jgi:hypothetical protein
MLGFDAVGTSSLGGTQRESANFAQAVTCAATAAVTWTRSTGKNVSIAVTGAVVQAAKQITKAVSIASTGTASCRKAVTFAVQTIAATGTALALKETGKSVNLVAIVTALDHIRETGKMVVVNVPTAISSFVAVLKITSRLILQDAVDCVLAGAQYVRERGREYEVYPTKQRHKTMGKRSGLQRTGPEPSFTVTTSKKGHD